MYSNLHQLSEFPIELLPYIDVEMVNKRVKISLTPLEIDSIVKYKAHRLSRNNFKLVKVKIFRALPINPALLVIQFV
jgi:hypothetical protein